MLELAEYLCRSSLRFKFDGELIGLDHEMKVKYMMEEFSVDVEGYEEYFKNMKKDIKNFFK